MSEETETSFRKLVYTISAAATLAYAGWLGSAMIGVRDRLTGIETTISENREERQGQVLDLRSRIQRLESDLYRRRNEAQER